MSNIQINHRKKKKKSRSGTNTSPPPPAVQRVVHFQFVQREWGPAGQEALPHPRQGRENGKGTPHPRTAENKNTRMSVRENLDQKKAKLMWYTNMQEYMPERIICMRFCRASYSDFGSNSRRICTSPPVRCGGFCMRHLAKFHFLGFCWKSKTAPN